MPLPRKTKLNPLLPNDYRSKSGTLLRGNNVYNGGGRSPNPVGRNQHSTIATIAAKQLKKNKAMLKKRIV
jgi:hypothetical protein